MAEWESDTGASPKARIYSFSDGRKMDSNVVISSRPINEGPHQDGTISILLVLLNGWCVRFSVIVRFVYYADVDSSGKSMDERRKEHIAYEYLCHLEEAKK